MNFRQFGLIGKKLGHSFSKKYFTQKFKEGGIHAAYELYEISDINRLEDLIDSISDLQGLNVTIPYKLAVIPFLDSLSPEAEAVQAVNTILFKDGKRKGHNTDVYGFRISLEKFLKGKSIDHALILGTGGAANAVEYVLSKQPNIKTYSFVSRKPTNAQYSYEALTEELILASKLIINTTPLGMYPNIEHTPALPYQFLNETHFLYDLVYNPDETLFMKKGIEKGAQVLNGMEMLIGQAEKAWEIWNS